MFLWLPNFCRKSFGFFYIRLLVCFRVTPSQLLIEFSFVVLESPVFSVLFYSLSISLQTSFFGQDFLVYFLKLYCYFPVLPPVPSPPRLFQRLSFLIILACFRSFLFAFPVEFPIPVLTVSSCFLRGSQFSHKLIWHLHRLGHLTRVYYSSVCKVVCDLFYLFLS